MILRNEILISQKKGKKKCLLGIWLNGWVFVYKLSGSGLESAAAT